MKILNSLLSLKKITFSLLLFNFFSYAELDNTAQDWQTFETENFRVHYTPQYKQWALSSAREMEQVRTLIQKQQGRVLDEKVDTYIIDPLNAANGFAIPLSNAPYMTLFATPPQSDSVIANSTGWQQLLVLHEYVHLVHLGQKSRSDWRNNIANWYDIYDASQITEHRWVSEGYATLLESKLTGRGRLYNNAVEAIIQQFAREGALPNYKQLSRVTEDYLSGSMAYLMGVRYLKWLEENYGEATLDAVWTRWRAVKERSFDEAFEGVFQDSAKHLYQRFIAEYTFKALTKEQRYPENTSTLWLNLTGAISAPSISPNGKYLALVEQSPRNNKPRKVFLSIYSTEVNSEKQQKFNNEVDALLKNDPQDIARKAPAVFKRKKKFSLNQIDAKGINNPRWLDNDTIIYGATTIDRNNQKHQDLFSWHIPSNSIKQLTTSANIRRFDIANINTSNPFIIAERSLFGNSQLVKLAINGQLLQELTPASVESIYDFVRIKPQQDREKNTNNVSFAYVQTTLNKKWQLKVSTLDKTTQNIVSEHIVPMPIGYQFLSFPEWSKNGENLFYVAGTKGETKLYQYNFATQQLTNLTSGQQPISWPIALNEDQFLYLAINSQGPDVYHLNLKKSKKENIADTTQSGIVYSQLASKFVVDKAQITADETIGFIKPYGIGPQQGTLTLGASYNSASSNILELGYKSSDALQRFDWQINISQDIINNTLSGYSGNIRWQGWPVKLSTHVYQFTLKPQQQGSSSLTLDELEEKGLHFQAIYPYRYNTFTFSTIGQIKIAKLGEHSNKYAALGFSQSWFHDQQTWGLNQKSTLHYLSGNTGNNKNNNYNGSNGSLTLIGHLDDFFIGFDYSWANRSDDAGNILSLGGFNSTLIQPKAHLNIQLAPELAFYQQQGNDYEKLSAFIPFKGIQAFYNRYKMQRQITIDTYGIKGEISNIFGFTGVNNLIIDYGVAQVNEQYTKSETQAWLGLWHKW